MVTIFFVCQVSASISSSNLNVTEQAISNQWLLLTLILNAHNKQIVLPQFLHNKTLFTKSFLRFLIIKI